MEFRKFSLELRRLTLKRGSVFKMTMFRQDGIVPKGENSTSRDKYFVIIGTTDDSVLIGTVIINTDINARLYNKIASYQHQLKATDYDYLDGKDRYVNCYELFEFSYDRILDKAEYIGLVEEPDMDYIIHKLQSSPAIRKGILRRYLPA
ncbi:MAG: hypothetical protein K2I68_03970 [Bacteroidales bacterium]|nr:hypothetical protein [Bacteroidales bacterium]